MNGKSYLQCDFDLWTLCVRLARTSLICLFNNQTLCYFTLCNYVALRSLSKNDGNGNVNDDARSQ